MSEANQTQIGGEHYKADEGAQARAEQVGLNKVPEHWDIVHVHELDYFQGAITKYVMRHKKKRGIEDLKKARHFLDKYVELLEAGEEQAEEAARIAQEAERRPARRTPR